MAIKYRNSHPSMGVDLNDRPAWQMYIGVILMDRFLQEISHINSYVRHKLNIKTGLISPRGENVNTFGSLLNKTFHKITNKRLMGHITYLGNNSFNKISFMESYKQYTKYLGNVVELFLYKIILFSRYSYVSH